MKKKWIVGLLVSCIGVISGCATHDTKTVSTSSESKSVITQKKQTSQESTSRHTASQTTAQSSTNKTDAQSLTGSTTSREATTAVSTSLQTAFPNEKTPTAAVAHHQAQLNIAAVQEGNRFSVLYFDMDHPVVLNGLELNQVAPIAHYEKVSYASNQEARQAVNQLTDLGGQEVDLGYGIKGYRQGGAGSSYISWKEGNWYLTVQASNLAGQDPVPTTQTMVTFLEKAFLPVPREAGQIFIHLNQTGYQANEVVWQQENVVYRVSHQDVIAALTMATSLAK